ncbi:MAG: hypothetical protein ACYS47_19990 [Planctomycetota bacterium]|jgi:hypothetical protein
MTDRKRGILVVLFLTVVFLCLTGCATTDGYWTFYVTGNTIPAYFKGIFGEKSSGLSILGATPEIAVFVAAFVFVAIPAVMLAFDFVFLPFAILHDIWLGANREPDPMELPAMEEQG